MEAMVSRPNLLSLRRSGLGLAVAAIAGILVAGIVALSAGKATLPAGPAGVGSGESLRGLEISRDAGPFLNGERVTISQTEERGGFEFLRPQDSIANDANIRGVFYEEAAADTVPGGILRQAAIDYESGVVMIVRPSDVDSGFSDPATQYAKMAANYPTPGYARVTVVHGVPALVVQENERGGAYVDLVLDGLRIQLYAKYAPVTSSQLVKAAESIS